MSAGQSRRTMREAQSRNRISEFLDYQRSSLALWCGDSIREQVKRQIAESHLYHGQASRLAVY